MKDIRKFYGDAIIKFEDIDIIGGIEELKLEYYQIENLSLQEGTSKYGIEIIKKKNYDDSIILDKKEIKNISNTENEVNNILNILQRNKVTPISAGDIIEDLLKETIYSVIK